MQACTLCACVLAFKSLFVIDFEFRSQRATIAIVSQLYCDVTHTQTHAKALQQPVLSFWFERIYIKKKPNKKIVHKYFSLRLRLLSAVKESDECAHSHTPSLILPLSWQCCPNEFSTSQEITSVSIAMHNRSKLLCHLNGVWCTLTCILCATNNLYAHTCIYGYIKRVVISTDFEPLYWFTEFLKKLMIFLKKKQFSNYRYSIHNSLFIAIAKLVRSYQCGLGQRTTIHFLWLLLTHWML